MFICGFFILTCTSLAQQIINPAPAVPPNTRVPMYDPAVVEALMQALPDKPTGFAPPITDRTTWESPEMTAACQWLYDLAEERIKLTIPPWDDELYLEFFRTGDRTRGEAMMGGRRAGLIPCVYAECHENKGRFLPWLLERLEGAAAEPVWTIPAGDRGGETFHGKRVHVDLASTRTADNIATILHMLGDRVPDELRARLMERMEQHIWAPMRIAIESEEVTQFWTSRTNNWNSVCWNGVGGATLALHPDKKFRAQIVSAALHSINNYLSGFTDDGYCDEGAGYWNYGFSNFLALREKIWQATDGKFDLCDNPKVAQVALYGLRIQLHDGLAPVFGDTRPGTHPDISLVLYCNQAMSLGIGSDQESVISDQKSSHSNHSSSPSLPSSSTISTASIESTVSKGSTGVPPVVEGVSPSTPPILRSSLTGIPLLFDEQLRAANPLFLFSETPERAFFLDTAPRSLARPIALKQPVAVDNDGGHYFSDATVLISRAPEGEPVTIKPTGLFSFFRSPTTKRVPPLAAAIKAGGNGSHSHDDIGSYVIFVGSQQLTGDPGGPIVYSADTFNEKRYDNPLMNSYGHPVPVVAGKLQRRATEVKPDVIKIDRNTVRDRFIIDMRPAYDVPELATLERIYLFGRGKNLRGATIIDKFEFTEPQTFETAFIANGEWKQLDVCKVFKKAGFNCLCGGSLMKNHPEEAERTAMFIFSRNGEEIFALVKTSDPFEVLTDTILNADTSNTRIGIRFKDPVQKGDISVSFFDYKILTHSITL